MNKSRITLKFGLRNARNIHHVAPKSDRFHSTGTIAPLNNPPTATHLTLKTIMSTQLTQLNKKEIIARMYEHLTTDSILGGLARKLFVNYPRIANAVLWVAVTKLPIKSVHVTFTETDYGFSFKYPNDNNNFWWRLSEADDRELEQLEEVLPELKDFP